MEAELLNTFFVADDESDEEDSRPARKRRLAERAVEGEAAEDEEVSGRVRCI